MEKSLPYITEEISGIIAQIKPSVYDWAEEGTLEAHEYRMRDALRIHHQSRVAHVAILGEIYNWQDETIYRTALTEQDVADRITELEESYLMDEANTKEVRRKVTIVRPNEIRRVQLGRIAAAVSGRCRVHNSNH